MNYYYTSINLLCTYGVLKKYKSNSYHTIQIIKIIKEKTKQNNTLNKINNKY